MVPLYQALLMVMAAMFVGLAGAEAAYRNGVNDGYMFSKDPTCPGYRKAGRILKQYGKI